MELHTASPSDTREVAAAIARLARSGDIVLLTGDMGVGKTVFAQGFGAALGVAEPMTSPTFTLVNSYQCGSLTLHHADLYRLERTGEVADLALAELAEFSGVLLVEWGEAAAATVRDHLEVHLDVDDADADALDEVTGRVSWRRSWRTRWRDRSSGDRQRQATRGVDRASGAVRLSPSRC
jgi:tRNA threonylcarbamoyladenosine biosynthesis protein TsaE